MSSTRRHFFYDEIIDRIKNLENIESDAKIAALLGMTRGAFSARKLKNSLPLDEIVDYCAEKGRSLDYVIYGIGESQIGAAAVAVAEARGAYAINSGEPLYELAGQIYAQLCEARKQVTREQFQYLFAFLHRELIESTQPKLADEKVARTIALIG